MDGENRRKDPELRRLFDEIQKGAQECRDMHVEVMKEIKVLSLSQERTKERVQGVSKGMQEVRESVLGNNSKISKLEGVVSEHGKDLASLFNRKVSGHSALSERNVRLMIIMGILVVLTLGGIAGYNVLSSNSQIAGIIE